MKTIRKPVTLRAARLASLLRGLLLAALGSAATAASGQSIIASGEISGVQASPGVYDYSLTISEGTGTTTPIGSIWYAWVPGVFFLPSTPTSAAAPTGWQASIVANSIQFYSSSPAADIAPGGSLTFSYVASFSPTLLAAAANSGVSVAYAGAVDASSPNETFTVQLVPEPSAAITLICGLAGLCLAGGIRRRTV